MHLSLQLVTILVGVLALAAPRVLARVELVRLAWGGEMAGPGVVRLAVEDCRYLGRRGYVVVDRLGRFPAYVVDCQSARDRETQPMHERGLVADVDWPALNHRRAIVVLEGK